jgi:hypothetical protein
MMSVEQSAESLAGETEVLEENLPQYLSFFTDPTLLGPDAALGSL